MSGQHDDTIQFAALAAGAIGVPGAYSFGLDVTVISGVWATMMAKIAEDSGHAIDRDFLLKVAAGVAAGIGAYVGGSKLCVQILRWIPGAGQVAAMAVNGTANYVYTYRLGKAFAELFGRPGFEWTDAANIVTTLVPLVGRAPAPAPAPAKN